MKQSGLNYWIKSVFVKISANYVTTLYPKTKKSYKSKAWDDSLDDRKTKLSRLKSWLRIFSGVISLGQVSLPLGTSDSLALK